MPRSNWIQQTLIKHLLFAQHRGRCSKQERNKIQSLHVSRDLKQNGAKSTQNLRAVGTPMIQSQLSLEGMFKASRRWELLGEPQRNGQVALHPVEKIGAGMMPGNGAANAKPQRIGCSMRNTFCFYRR